MATGCVCLFTSLLGYVGIMLNNRAILSYYCLLLWPCFGLIAAVGYTAFRKNKWEIDRKLSFQWHRTLTPDGRSRIQANVKNRNIHITSLFSDFYINIIIFYLLFQLFYSFIVVVIKLFQISMKIPTNAFHVLYYQDVDINIHNLQLAF